jgi:hypothetical protein
VATSGDDTMRLLVLVLLLPLAGCGYTMYLSDADEHGGTVNMVTDLTRDAALEKARDHCHQYNLDMRIVSESSSSNSLMFSCQPAGPVMTAPPGV